MPSGSGNPRLSMQMEKTVVLYPGLAVSHFVPMMRLGGALVEHGYAVSVALIDPAVNPDAAFGAVVAGAATSMPSVRFHTLPLVENPPRVTLGAQFLVSYYNLVHSYNDRLRDFLCSFTRVHAVFVDSLSAEALGVAKTLGIPGYLMFTSSAATLAAFAQLPYYTLAKGSGTSFRELGDTPVELFGLPPIPASHLFGEALGDPESDTYKATMAGMSMIPDTGDGILVNTFESLEARAVAALADPRFLPAGRVMPPVYCLGPFLGGIGEAKERHDDCLVWLDAQPDRSVVFLCFGSTGTANHSEEQLREIAAGLENSGHRFLWVVRAPRGDDPDLHALLPDGFLDRTGGRRPRPRRQAVGAAGRGAPPQGHRRVRHALRLELRARGRDGGRAHAVLAASLGAEDEQGAHGWGDGGRRGDDRMAAGAGAGRRGGAQGEAGHGVPRGQGDQGARGCTPGGGRRGLA